LETRNAPTGGFRLCNGSTEYDVAALQRGSGAAGIGGLLPGLMDEKVLKEIGATSRI